MSDFDIIESLSTRQDSYVTDPDVETYLSYLRETRISKRGGRETTSPFLNKLRDAWHSMQRRCNDPKHDSYKNYGGRGIKVLFKSFKEFHDEIGEPPSLKHTVDRKDSNGHYAPGNVRWATRYEQSRDHRKYITYVGITRSVKQWAAELGMPYGTLSGRIRKGWPVELALTPPRAGK